MITHVTVAYVFIYHIFSLKRLNFILNLIHFCFHHLVWLGLNALLGWLSLKKCFRNLFERYWCSLKYLIEDANKYQLICVKFPPLPFFYIDFHEMFFSVVGLYILLQETCLIRIFNSLKRDSKMYTSKISIKRKWNHESFWNYRFW